MTDHQIVQFLRGVHEYLGEACFLRGAFVFEDPHHDIVKHLLMDGRGLACGAWRAWWKTTHKKVALQPDVVASLDVENWRWVPITGQKLMQYERWLSPKAAYMCNESCLQDESSPICEGRKDAKGVMLVYHFRTGHSKYTFVKLERAVSFHPEHVLHAVRRYVFGKEKMDGTERREDCGKKCRLFPTYNFLNEKHVACAYGEESPADVQTKVESATKYESIRTGDEVFIPMVISRAYLK